MNKKHPTHITALLLNYGWSLLWILIPVVIASLLIFPEVTVKDGLLSMLFGVIGLIAKYIHVKIRPIGIWFDLKGELIWYVIIGVVSFIAIINDLIPFLA